MQCPQCSSQKTWKDGIRYLATGETRQRYLCRLCGCRFSQSNIQLNVIPQISPISNSAKNVHKVRIASGNRTVKESSDGLSFSLGKDVCSHGCSNLSIIEKGLNVFPNYNRYAKVGDSKGESKNLAATEIEKQTVAGTSPTTQQDIKGLITQFMAYLEKEGYGKESKYPHNLKTLVNLGADLLNPESVKETLGKHNIKSSAKLQYVYSYTAFLKMLKLTWTPPRYKQENTLPFIPDETELDQLIASCRSRRMAAYLQCLKETYADPGEVLKLRWIDISKNIITINKTVKGHLPRQIEVSNKLISMLNALPKASERIFPTKYQVMFSCYNRVRKRAAELQKNPRLLSIELRTFRHWGGTMIAHYTNGNVLTVKKLLGHKRIENTMKYISMIHFKDDEFETATATTDEEIKKLGAAGFMKYDERKLGETCISYYRKPKRFSKYVS